MSSSPYHPGWHPYCLPCRSKPAIRFARASTSDGAADVKVKFADSKVAMCVVNIDSSDGIESNFNHWLKIPRIGMVRIQYSLLVLLPRDDANTAPGNIGECFTVIENYYGDEIALVHVFVFSYHGLGHCTFLWCGSQALNHPVRGVRGGQPSNISRIRVVYACRTRPILFVRTQW